MNTKIVVATFIIAGTGIANAYLNEKNPKITPIIIGSYILLLILSILDMLGGGLAQLSSGLAMVAVVFVLLHEFPWQQITNLAQGKKA
jgi:hypothetical protein